MAAAKCSPQQNCVVWLSQDFYGGKLHIHTQISPTASLRWAWSPLRFSLGPLHSHTAPAWACTWTQSERPPPTLGRNGVQSHSEKKTQLNSTGSPLSFCVNGGGLSKGKIFLKAAGMVSLNTSVCGGSKESKGRKKKKDEGMGEEGMALRKTL